MVVPPRPPKKPTKRRPPPRPRAGSSARARSRSRQPYQKAPRTARGILIVLWLLWSIPLAVLFLAGAAVGLAMSAMPELPALEQSTAKRTVESVVLARDGSTVLRRIKSDGARRYVDESAVTPVLERAVMAAEDRRFLHHDGVDLQGVARAAIADLRSRSAAQGGSSITQQLIKNAYLGPERNIARKSREAALAWALETRWSKRRIMTAYLNSAYFGDGTYGIADAARHFCRTSVRDLNVAQASLLAAVLPAPELLNPAAAPEAARAARQRVLDAQLELGWITKKQHATASAEPICRPARRRRARELAPHFTDSVVGELIAERGQAQITGTGLRIITTLDPRTQRAARSALTALEATGLSAAVVAIDPRSGEVRASASTAPAAQASLDLVRGAHRQPGSAFKPFILLATFAEGIPPTAPLKSAPYARRQPDGSVYRVTNDGGYSGTTSVQAATWASDNTAFARLADQVGRPRVIDAARRSGIVSPMLDLPSIALGALPEGVTPLEMAHAYATIAMHGSRRGNEHGQPISITEVRAPQTDSWQVKRSRSRAVSRPVADLTTQVLHGVVTKGTATRADPQRPAAGKTGTTENNSDAWFVGYTPELVVAVWVGYSHRTIPMRTEFQGGPVFGGTWPAEIWRQTVMGALKGRPVHQFNLRPAQTISVGIDASTGNVSGSGCPSTTKLMLAHARPTTTNPPCEVTADPDAPLNQPTIDGVMPDVLGLPYADARSMLEALGVSVRLREARGANAELGSVRVQSTDAGLALPTAVTLDVVTSAPGGGRVELAGEQS